MWFFLQFTRTFGITAERLQYYMLSSHFVFNNLTDGVFFLQFTRTFAITSERLQLGRVGPNDYNIYNIPCFLHILCFIIRLIFTRTFTIMSERLQYYKGRVGPND